MLRSQRNRVMSVEVPCNQCVISRDFARDSHRRFLRNFRKLGYGLSPFVADASLGITLTCKASVAPLDYPYPKYDRAISVGICGGIAFYSTKSYTKLKKKKEKKTSSL